ncbi:ATP-binding protein [Desulfitibacter alkalitolerans]|uniref:ATP-binding protein n=1 Tax=Desulfitibacter alkalitolerans TaxID=264641 RepID=UPI000484FE9E|nr:ATP-binding protein [Desulfitibacter alkalitolerans]
MKKYIVEIKFRSFKDFKNTRRCIEEHIIKLMGRDKSLFMRVAFNEALNNALFHGNGGDQEKYITVKLRTIGSRLIMRIKDSGEGFRWIHKIF